MILTVLSFVYSLSSCCFCCVNSSYFFLFVFTPSSRSCHLRLQDIPLRILIFCSSSSCLHFSTQSVPLSVPQYNFSYACLLTFNTLLHMKHSIILSCYCTYLLVSLDLLTYQWQFLHLSTPHSSNCTCFTAIRSSMLLLLRDAMKLQFH